MTFKELEAATCRDSVELVTNMPMNLWHYLIGEFSNRCEELERLGFLERGETLSGMQWPIWRKVKDIEAD
ncbi:MAG: hypothetical protein V7731_11965 [Amphritea sp.]